MEQDREFEGVESLPVLPIPSDEVLHFIRHEDCGRRLIIDACYTNLNVPVVPRIPKDMVHQDFVDLFDKRLSDVPGISAEVLPEGNIVEDFVHLVHSLPGWRDVVF